MSGLITIPLSRTLTLELGRVYRASRVMVILHPTNRKFHRPSCYHFDPSQPAMTMKQARLLGGIPCGICYP